MQYSYLGNSGLRVSDFCLGTMTFGHSTGDAEAQRIVSAALDAGLTFFDTADSYSAGESERMLGAALGSRRDDVVVATKFTNAMGSGPNDSGWSRAHLMKAVEGSLRRLGTDYIDLYYLHHTDDETPVEETLKTLDALVTQGKVRYIGCSNFEAWRLCDTLWTSIAAGFEELICYQGAYSLVMRDLEEEVLPFIRRKGLGFVAYWNLAAGFLSGKYAPGGRSVPGSRSEEGWIFPAERFHHDADGILKTLLETADTLGCNPAAAAIAWVKNKPSVTSTLVGARTLAQLEKNLQADGLELPPEEMRKLDEVSFLEPRYPRWMEEGQQARRDAALDPLEGSSREGSGKSSRGSSRESSRGSGESGSGGK